MISVGDARWHSKISKNALDKSISREEYGNTFPNRSYISGVRKITIIHLQIVFASALRICISIKGLPTFTAYILGPALHTITSSYCRAHECSSIQLNRFIFLFLVSLLSLSHLVRRCVRLIFRARSLSWDRSLLCEWASVRRSSKFISLNRLTHELLPPVLQNEECGAHREMICLRKSGGRRGGGDAK